MTYMGGDTVVYDTENRLVSGPDLVIGGATGQFNIGDVGNCFGACPAPDIPTEWWNPPTRPLTPDERVALRKALLAAGLTAAYIEQVMEREYPGIVFREGGYTLENFTPTLGKDFGGLSTYDSISALQNVLSNWNKAQVIDTTELKLLHANPDAPPPGHVSLTSGHWITDTAWAATKVFGGGGPIKGAPKVGAPSSYTLDVQGAWKGTVTRKGFEAGDFVQ